MANQLDLEEQEQLDQIKHFWKQYGNLITWILIAILGAYASWSGYKYWQRSQAAQAAVLYDEVERLSAQGDLGKVEQAYKDMRNRFGGTAFAMQSGLLVAKLHQEGGKTEQAREALKWVIDESPDPGYQAIARLRLAAVLAQAKDYTQAMAQLDAAYPAEFQPLVADRKGDILMLQVKPVLARAEYEKAYKGLDERNEYRNLVAVKLASLGADPRPVVDATVSGAQANAVEGRK